MKPCRRWRRVQEACRGGARWNATAVHGMKLPVHRIPRALVASIVAVVALGAACSHEIGDDCRSSVDCDPNGTRSCDLSQHGGYCTVVGCDKTSCPSGSSCIRTFPETFLAQAANLTVRPESCDPTLAISDCPMNPTDPTDPTNSKCASFGLCVRTCDPAADPTTCPKGQLCSSLGYCAQCDPRQEDIPPDGGAPISNHCLADEVCLDTGLCAKMSFEQRQCAKSCSSNGDCRSGYDCRKTGTLGSMVLATNPNAMTAVCAPHIEPLMTPAPSP